MSKTPILNALTRLEHEKIVVSQHNRGYYMKIWDAKDLFQMFELKTKIYDIVVDYALRNCTNINLLKVKKAMDEYTNYECEIYDANKFKLDLAFHLTFVQMAGNDYLTAILEQQYSIMAYAMDLSLFSPFIQQFEQEHMDIYNALGRCSAREVKRLLRYHNGIGQRVLGSTEKRAHRLLRDGALVPVS